MPAFIDGLSHGGGQAIRFEVRIVGLPITFTEEGIDPPTTLGPPDPYTTLEEFEEDEGWWA
jgi:hypothetical protein